MKDKLFTIPVTDAFHTDCECPICQMRKEVEENAIEFTMGPSYMEDDIREATSRLGFCENHLKQLYQNQNRLGLSLILKTHIDKLIDDIEKLSETKKLPQAASLFKKKDGSREILNYLEQLEETCFICEKIDKTMERYIATIFHLYSNSEEFRSMFKATKGFCTKHYKDLFAAAPLYFKGNQLNEFIQVLNQLYLNNMKILRDDLEWFIQKFDYRFANEPWKNSKDALPRTMQKTNSIL